MYQVGPGDDPGGARFGIHNFTKLDACLGSNLPSFLQMVAMS